MFWTWAQCPCQCTSLWFSFRLWKFSDCVLFGKLDWLKLIKINFSQSADTPPVFTENNKEGKNSTFIKINTNLTGPRKLGRYVSFGSKIWAQNNRYIFSRWIGPFYKKIIQFNFYRLMQCNATASVRADIKLTYWTGWLLEMLTQYASKNKFPS